MDRIILECTRESKEYASYRDFVQGDPAAILLVEVRGDSKVELAEKLAALQCEHSYAEPSSLAATAIKFGSSVLRGWDYSPMSGRCETCGMY